MKKIMSLFLIVFYIIPLFAAKTNVLASELYTPSGIEYSNIGNELDKYVEKYEAGLASCEVAVFDRNGIITNKYYGYSDIENRILANRDTVYDWGSCSKILVWVSVMQQVERGNIDLNTDIREYLPNGFLTKLQYEDEKITMINLMNHNAGFQESFYENQECEKDEVYDNLEEALRACECYQAYHVGEYTAYSNYGTALAAFIVERVSGMDYREYVKENIFIPLGMEHTSIDTLMTDNDYVREKREELKCYSRFEDPKYNADYGVCHSWVQLYPAGSAIGTLDDFAKFGMALASPDSALFERKSTWDEMISPTSYFGDSDIAKNCHGLWTTQCKVQILGHAGNTAGCSSMLAFDPVSGLGVAIMTNEPGETVFNFGIPNLIFGEITDLEEYAVGYVKDENDISGIYFSQRMISTGAVSFLKYMGMIFPIQKNEEGSYNISFGGLTVEPDSRLYKIADNQYVLERNGQKEFMYYSVTADGKGKLEMMSMDMITSKADVVKMVFVFATLILGMISIIVLIIKLVLFIIWKLRKKNLKLNKRIIATQIVYGANFAAISFYLNSSAGNVYWLTVISSLLAVGLGLFSAVNGVYLIYGVIKEKNIKIKSKINRCIWSLLSVMYFGFIITFQAYNFWAL